MTFRTFSACVSGINKKNGDPKPFCLVSNKLAQLIECPIMQSCSPALLGLNPVSYSCKIFKGNSTGQAFSVSDNCFTDYMIFIFLESLLFSREFFEFSFCGFGSFLLKVLSAVVHFLLVFINLFTAIKFTFGRNGKIHDTKINSKNILRINQGIFIHITNHGDIKYSTDKKKINFTMLFFYKFSLIVTTLKRYFLSAIHGPNRNHVIFHQSENTFIVRLPAMWFKISLYFFISLIRIRNFGYASCSHLSRQLKSAFNFPVCGSMQSKLAEYFIFKCIFRDPITGLIGCFKGLFKKSELLLIGG